MKRVRQTEIAERAGVSLTTVSRVVNQSGYVADEVRKKVEKAIAETGYVPTAHSFVQRKRLVGIISIHGMMNPYFDELARALQRECERLGYYALFAYSEKLDNASLIAHSRQMSSLGVCGLIACSFMDDHLEEKTRAALNKCSFPIVFIERTADCYGFNRVLVDNLLGTHTATRSLLDNGHRHLLYITKGNQTEADRSRMKGFTKAVGEMPEGSVTYQIQTCENVLPDAAYEATNAAYGQDSAITAIVAWNDMYALGALLYVCQHQNTLPKDVKIIGHDDILAPTLRPPISSVHMPMQEIASSAVEIIDKNLETNGFTPARTVLLEPTLIVR